jgi:hypothetical protein
VRTYKLSQEHHELNDLESEGWQFGSKLTTENVWDGFMLLLLLEDHQKQHIVTGMDTLTDTSATLYL